MTEPTRSRTGMVFTQDPYRRRTELGITDDDKTEERYKLGTLRDLLDNYGSVLRRRREGRPPPKE